MEYHILVYKVSTIITENIKCNEQRGRKERKEKRRKFSIVLYGFHVIRPNLYSAVYTHNTWHILVQFFFETYFFTFLLDRTLICLLFQSRGVRFTVFFHPHSNLITFVFIIHTLTRITSPKRIYAAAELPSFSVVIYSKCNFAHQSGDR